MEYFNSPKKVSKKRSRGGGWREEELLEVAELDERNFVAEEQNVVVITSTAMKVQHDYDVDKQR